MVQHAEKNCGRKTSRWKGKLCGIRNGKAHFQPLSGFSEHPRRKVDSHQLHSEGRSQKPGVSPGAAADFKDQTLAARQVRQKQSQSDTHSVIGGSAVAVSERPIVAVTFRVVIAPYVLQ